jgi:hypothetical protein
MQSSNSRKKPCRRHGTHDLGAPGFQVNTAARLAEIFATQRGDKLDLSGVAVIDPQLQLLPQIEPEGLLHMAGLFPSVPSQVNFELLLRPSKDNGACSACPCRSASPSRWRLSRPNFRRARLSSRETRLSSRGSRRRRRSHACL